MSAEAPTIQDAYRELVNALDAGDSDWRDALDVARPPEP
jgi:hypothetical protein